MSKCSLYNLITIRTCKLCHISIQHWKFLVWHLSNLNESDRVFLSCTAVREHFNWWIHARRVPFSGDVLTCTCTGIHLISYHFYQLLNCNYLFQISFLNTLILLNLFVAPSCFFVTCLSRSFYKTYLSNSYLSPEALTKECLVLFICCHVLRSIDCTDVSFLL